MTSITQKGDSIMKPNTLALSVLSILMSILLLACSKESISNGSTSSNPASNSAEVTLITPVPTVTAAPTETPIKEDTESLKNDTGKTMFKSFTKAKLGAWHTTVAIVSEKGTIAIADPSEIPMELGLVKADIITISHSHADHNDAIFEGKSSAARISKYTEESFTVKDMTVTGIPAFHASIIDETSYPTDFIYVYEVDGLRIAHFGDMGEDQLTEKQLKQLGKIDILFTRFSNVSGFGASTEKTIALLKQIKPSVALALHYEPEVIDEVLKTLKITDRSELDTFAINKKDLESIKGTKFVLLK
jgi:hypothetical protein